MKNPAMKKTIAAVLLSISLAAGGIPAEVFASSDAAASVLAEESQALSVQENEANSADDAADPGREGSGAAAEEGSGSENTSASGTDVLVSAGSEKTYASGTDTSGSAEIVEGSTDGTEGEGTSGETAGDDTVKEEGGNGGSSDAGEGSTGDTSGEGGTGDTSGEGGTGDTSGEGGTGDSSGEGGTGDTSGEGGTGDTSGEGGTGGTSGEGGAGDTPGEGGTGGTSGEGGTGEGGSTPSTPAEDEDEDDGTISIAKAKITGISSYYLRTGHQLMPTVRVKLGGKTLKLGRDYAVIYGVNLGPGTGNVVVIGINDYSGIRMVSFDIYSVLTLKAACRTKGMKLTWTSGQAASSYTIYRKSGSGAFEEIGSTASLSFYDRTAVSGNTYSYRVVGEGCASKDISATYLATPFISRLGRNSKGVKITWQAVDGATAYRVYAVRNGKYVKLANCTGTTYTDTGVETGKTYAYTVRAISPVSSDYERAGTSIACLPCPTLLKAENAANGCLLGWTGVEGTVKYKIYRRKAGGSWSYRATTYKTEYTDTTAEAGVSYQYRICCADKNGWLLSKSNCTASITRLLAPVLRQAEYDAGKVTISWQKSAGATRYRVYRKTPGSGLVKLSNTAALSFVDDTVEEGQTYTYVVRAIKPTKSLYDRKGLTITAGGEE